LKVVLFGPYPVDTRFTRGGVEKVMFNTVEGLRERGEIDLHVVSLSRVRQGFSEDRGDHTVHFVPQQQRLSLPTFRFLSVLRARRAIRAIDPDLVHCQESGRESFIASALGYPTVVTLHAVFRNEAAHYPGLRSRARYWQIVHLARRAIPRVDRYIPSSAYVSREMTEVAHKLHEVVENPIEQRYFDVPDATVPGRLLFAGTIYQRKGIEVLVAAATALRGRGVPFRVHVCGGVGSGEYHEALQAQVRAEGLTGDVVFRGFLSEEDLLREFGEAAVVVLPSYAETSPMTVQQAMAAGKPVVATTVGGIPQLVTDGECGRLVEPGDVAGLAEGLAEVLSDPGRRREMGARARREAEARFSVRAVAEKHVEIYRQLLKGGFAS
jgi:glycosyltransferase involved in cell wall biosynthesis